LWNGDHLQYWGYDGGRGLGLNVGVGVLTRTTRFDLGRSRVLRRAAADGDDGVLEGLNGLY